MVLSMSAAAHLHRAGRTDVGARGHGRHVGGQGDEGAGAGGPAAAGRHEDDHRHVAASWALTMSRMEVSRPPGVSSRITRATAPAASAPSMPSTRNSAATGVMGPS